jgi:hypothetical protein
MRKAVWKWKQHKTQDSSTKKKFKAEIKNVFVQNDNESYVLERKINAHQKEKN